MFLDQPVEDPGDRVPLLARRVQVRPQDLVDHRLVAVQPGRPRRQLLARLRPGRVQRLPHRPPRHAVLALKPPHRHAATVVTPDRRVQLDLRHPRHDQHLSPGACRRCPGKNPRASQTRRHHPSVDPAPPKPIDKRRRYCSIKPVGPSTRYEVRDFLAWMARRGHSGTLLVPHRRKAEPEAMDEDIHWDSSSSASTTGTSHWT